MKIRDLDYRLTSAIASFISCIFFMILRSFEDIKSMSGSFIINFMVIFVIIMVGIGIGFIMERFGTHEKYE